MFLYNTMLYACLAVIALFSWIFFKWRSSTGKGIPPPSPPGWPIIGNILERDPGGMHLTFYKWAEKYGPIFSCSLMGKTAVFLNNTELLRKVFVSEEYGRSAIDKTETFMGKYIYWDHKGIITGKGIQKTFNLRKLFHNALHFYGEGVSKFEELVQTELRRLTKQIDEFSEADFDPKPVISTSLGNIVAILLSGESIRPGDCDIIWKFNEATDQLLDIRVSAVLSALPFMRNMPGKYGRTFKNAIDARDSLLERFYEKNKKTYRTGSTRGLVDYFLKMQEEETAKGDADAFTDVDIKALVIDIIIAGTLTTTSAITSAVLLLLHNPHCAAKMRKEIHDVIGLDEAPAFEHRGRMPYVNAVILEVLRIVSVSPFGAPHRVYKEVTIEGYTIAKGTRIFMNNWYLQHDPKIWGDPWTFRPERFLDDNGLLVPIDHHLRQKMFPFGIGRRNCIGETLARSRIFLYLATMYQKFDISTPTNGQCGSGDVKTFHSGVVVMPGPFMVRAVRRW